jgi:hypothetical protein
LAAKIRLVNLLARLTPRETTPDSTGRVTLTCTNPGDDTAHVKLTVGTIAPATAIDSTGMPNADAFTDDSTAIAMYRRDTVAASASSTTWIHDLPHELILPPHASQQVVVRVVPPAAAAAGSYHAWILATTNLRDEAKRSAPKTQRMAFGVIMTTGGGPTWSVGQLRTYAERLQSGTKVTVSVVK